MNTLPGRFILNNKVTVRAAQEINSQPYGNPSITAAQPVKGKGTGAYAKQTMRADTGVSISLRPTSKNDKQPERVNDGVSISTNAKDLQAQPVSDRPAHLPVRSMAPTASPKRGPPTLRIMMPPASPQAIRKPSLTRRSNDPGAQSNGSVPPNPATSLSGLVPRESTPGQTTREHFNRNKSAAPSDDKPNRINTLTQGCDAPMKSVADHGAPKPKKRLMGQTLSPAEWASLAHANFTSTGHISEIADSNNSAPSTLQKRKADVITENTTGSEDPHAPGPSNKKVKVATSSADSAVATGQQSGPVVEQPAQTKSTRSGQGLNDVQVRQPSITGQTPIPTSGRDRKAWMKLKQRVQTSPKAKPGFVGPFPADTARVARRLNLYDNWLVAELSRDKDDPPVEPDPRIRDLARPKPLTGTLYSVNGVSAAKQTADSCTDPFESTTTSAKPKTSEGEVLRIHQIKESRRLNTTPATVWPPTAPPQQRPAARVFSQKATDNHAISSTIPYKTIPGSDFFLASPSNSPSTPRRSETNLQELQLSDSSPDFNSRIHGTVDRLRKGTDTWKFIDRGTRTKAGRAQGEGPNKAGVASQQLESSSSAHKSMESRVSEKAGNDGRTNQLEARGGAGQSASNENAGVHAAKSNKATEAEKQESSNIARDRNKKKAGKITSKRVTRLIVQRASANPPTDPDSSDSSDSSENESTDPSGDQSSSSSDDDSSDDALDASSEDSGDSSPDGSDEGDEKPAGDVGERKKQSPADSQEQSDDEGSQAPSWYGFSPPAQGSDGKSEDDPYSMRSAPKSSPRGAVPADNESRLPPLPSGVLRDLRYKDTPGLRRANDDSSLLSQLLPVQVADDAFIDHPSTKKRKRASASSDIANGDALRPSAESFGEEEQVKKRQKKKKSRVSKEDITQSVPPTEIEANPDDDVDWEGLTDAAQGVHPISVCLGNEAEVSPHSDCRDGSSPGQAEPVEVVEPDDLATAFNALWAPAEEYAKKSANSRWRAKAQKWSFNPEDMMRDLITEERSRRASGLPSQTFAQALAYKIGLLKESVVRSQQQNHDEANTEGEWTSTYEREVEINQSVLDWRARAIRLGVWKLAAERAIAWTVRRRVEHGQDHRRAVEVDLGLLGWKKLNPKPKSGKKTGRLASWKRHLRCERARLWQAVQALKAEDEYVETDNDGDC